jgi:hypothetical protein
MKTKVERKELLKQLIDVMPTMDVRPFVKVVNNIVSSLGTSVRGDFTDSVILGVRMPIFGLRLNDKSYSNDVI